MSALMLPLEIYTHIYSFLNTNGEFIFFLSTSKKLHKFKSKFWYNKTYFDYYHLPRKLIYKDCIQSTISVLGRKCLEKLPKNITHLYVLDMGDLKKGDIPSHVHFITIGICNVSIVCHIIPSTVKKLHFHGFYNWRLEKDAIPFGVKEIKFGKEFNQKIPKGIIPSSVERITFGYKFNQPIYPGDLPEGITHVTFGDKFNQRIYPNTLPQTLTYLSFGNDFNGITGPKCIPDSVTHLTMHFKSDTLSSEIFPPKLTHLTYNGFVNSVFPIVLPLTLRSITFGKYFNYPLEDLCLSDSIESITFGLGYGQDIGPDFLPKKLKNIHVSETFDNLIQVPESVTVSYY